MARVNKVGQPIPFGYQAPNKETGLTIVAEIYLPGKVKDSNFPDQIMPEVGSSGTYQDTFTPDAQGTWQVIMHKDDGDSQVTKSFEVGGDDVHSVGEKVTGVDGKINTVDGKVDTVDGKITAVDGKVDAVDVQLDTVESKVDAIDTKVSSLDTPPMAF